MSSSLREMVWEALTADSQLHALGYPAEGVFGNFAVADPADSLAQWLVLRWGAAEPAPGRDTTARPLPLTIAAYNRAPNFDPIDKALRRIRTILIGLEAQTFAGGAVLGVGPPVFSSEDGWDDAYNAVVRSETYRIVASGT